MRNKLKNESLLQKNVTSHDSWPHESPVNSQHIAPVIEVSPTVCCECVRGGEKRICIYRTKLIAPYPTPDHSSGRSFAGPINVTALQFNHQIDGKRFISVDFKFPH